MNQCNSPVTSATIGSAALPQAGLSAPQPEGIELFQSGAMPEGHHAVTAPGGYEWWYFDAEDREHDRQIVVILLEGFVFHPAYLRRYARYRRRPTQYRPPLPREYCCAYFVVYDRGRISHQMMLQYPPEDFAAATDRLDVWLGPNRAVEADGKIAVTLRGTPWELTWQGPRLREGMTLTGEFNFTPRLQHPPMQRTFLSRRMTGAEHSWVLARPLCEVRGIIRCFDPQAPGEGLGIRFHGLGYHDHNYGTGPLGPGLKRWIWGRVLFEDALFTFHHAVPRERGLKPESHLVEADAHGIREVPIACLAADWSAISPLLLRYPRELSIDDTMRLHNPRLIDSSPFYLRLIYDATCRGRAGSAFCEVAYPNRLRWPVLGRMIEMSIRRA
ncbi:MAG: hypothetical protein NZ561_09000 [Phycisphaerae bacterium]|nr:hypothetical protein [Phycisphaerae bacterium]MDW8263419.1 hypothetical protein [Phycisphaerales bacterium]